MEAFEANAIAGFVSERRRIENDADVMKDLDGDGDIDETKVRVFLFRKNGADQDLI